ncbi:MAG: TIM barrel protein, partial [Patescibacteria group bacterium]
IPIEVGALQPEVFDQIPKQHFKEMNRMAKLAGAKISVHAPLVEPSGIGEQGWNESNRELAERQLKNVVEKSFELDPSGGMPITIHSSGLPGKEYKMIHKKEGDEGKREVEKIIIVDRETGKPSQIEEETMYYPVERTKEGIFPANLEKRRFMSPEKRVENINHMQWDNAVSQLIFNKERADEILQQNRIQAGEENYYKIKTGQTNFNDLVPQEQQAVYHLQNADMYLQDTQTNVEALFHKAYKNSTPEQQEVLKEISKEYANALNKSGGRLTGQSQAMQGLLLNLKQITPQLFQPIEEFARGKSAETLGNVAFSAFQKFKDKAPTLSIENMYPGMAFSSAEELKELVDASRKEFVNLAEKKGMSKTSAEKQAEKMIGVTLDVGHLNIARKKGFTDEDLRKEAEAIAKYVKHVHLTDNFGFSDSHLPPGMGNVPFKDILEELEKAGKGDVRKIVEAGGFVQHFGTSPYPVALEAMGSPIYSMEMAPYWNQAIGLQ